VRGDALCRNEPNPRLSADARTVCPRRSSCGPLILKAWQRTLSAGSKVETPDDAAPMDV
jgi:hypothetical protein